MSILFYVQEENKQEQLNRQSKPLPAAFGASRFRVAEGSWGFKLAIAAIAAIALA